MKFSDRPRDLRERAGLTQQGLAQKAVVSPATLRGLEGGRHRPSWKSVVKLARALGVSTDVFADCDEVPGHGSGGREPEGE
jgi:transcriptional regulator with XRE-family HTH domain